jgi:hypothetical protein
MQDLADEFGNVNLRRTGSSAWSIVTIKASSRFDWRLIIGQCWMQVRKILFQLLLAERRLAVYRFFHYGT